MKKILIAVGVVALAAMTQAASVKWNSGTVKAATDASGTAGTANATSYTAYLYTFDSLAAYTAAQSTAVDALYSTYVGKVTPVTTANAKPNGTANITQSGQPDGSSTDPVTVYGMVIYVDTATAATYANVDAFVKVGFATDSYQDTTGLSFGNMGTQQANWTAVPEPTSGLLMLLGMAGLALRRRRA